MLNCDLGINGGIVAGNGRYPEALYQFRRQFRWHRQREHRLAKLARPQLKRFGEQAGGPIRAGNGEGEGIRKRFAAVEQVERVLHLRAGNGQFVNAAGEELHADLFTRRVEVAKAARQNIGPIGGVGDTFQAKAQVHHAERGAVTCRQPGRITVFIHKSRVREKFQAR